MPSAQASKPVGMDMKGDLGPMGHLSNSCTTAGVCKSSSAPCSDHDRGTLKTDTWELRRHEGAFLVLLDVTSGKFRQMRLFCSLGCVMGGACRQCCAHDRDDIAGHAAFSKLFGCLDPTLMCWGKHGLHMLEVWYE